MDDLDKLLAEIRAEDTPKPTSSYSQADIDAFSLKGVRQPGSLVSRQGGTVDLTDFGSRMATGRKQSKKPPTEVELEYFRIVKENMAQGKPVPYLEYKGERWYYNRGGKKGEDGIKDLSLRSLKGKLKNEATYAQARDTQTPKLEDYEEAFPGRGKEMYEAERAKRKLQVKAQKDAIKRTGVDFDLDHMRPNMNQGRTHSRNFRLMNAGRNRLEQNRRPLTDTQLTALKQDATNNVDYLRTQGPEMTPRQRQNVIEGVTELPTVNLYRQGVQAKRAGKILKNAPLLGGFVMATGTLLATGDAGQAAKAFVETENPIENLDAGPVFDEREDYGKVIQDAKKQNAIPLLDRLRQGVLGTRAIRGRSGAQKAFRQP